MKIHITLELLEATLDLTETPEDNRQVSNRRKGNLFFLGSSFNLNFVFSCRLFRRILQRSHSDPRTPFGKRRRHPSLEHSRWKI